MLPFSFESLFAFFGEYNRSVWPAAIIANLLGAVLLYTFYRKAETKPRLVFIVLGMAWLWVGAVFYMTHLAMLFFAAPYFGGIFLLQGLILLWTGYSRSEIIFRDGRDYKGIAGYMFMVFALLMYPVADGLLGTGWPDVRFFGIAPEPTILFTLGALMLIRPQAPFNLLILPIIVSFVTLFTTWVLAILQDWLIPFAAIAAIFFIYGYDGGVDGGKNSEYIGQQNLKG